MQKLLIWLIIYIGDRHEQFFLRHLAKLEFGLAVFCYKLARIASDEGKHNLAAMLHKHGQDEEKHGKMLASWSDRAHRIRLRGNGQWISFNKDGQELIQNHPEPDTPGVKITSENFTGIFNNFDGLSKRYLSLWLLFGGKSAADYDWADRLAFMHVLERGTSQFYQVLAQKSKSPALQAIANQIYRDELEHADYLKSTSLHLSLAPDFVKWEIRVGLASWGLLYDIQKHLLSSRS